MNERIAIVASEFNKDITSPMLEIAKQHVSFLGGKTSHAVWVPGVFDMPLAIKRLIERKDVDAVVTLGAVIKGETSHDEVVAHNAARKMADLSVQYGKPVSLGISGPGMSRPDAVKRMEGYAKNSVEAAFKMLKNLPASENEP